MKYKVVYDKSVLKFLGKHPELQIPLHDKVQLLAIGETATLDIKSLQWEVDCYRLRIRGYRFLYEIHNEELIIYFYKAGSRGDVYK